MPCKQPVATMWTKGTANWVKWRGTAVAERGWIATLHPIHGTQRKKPWIHGGTGVCKARFQGAASPCSRWPIASFTLSGFTNPVRLHAVYPCILGLTVWSPYQSNWSFCETVYHRVCFHAMWQTENVWNVSFLICLTAKTEMTKMKHWLKQKRVTAKWNIYLCNLIQYLDILHLKY